MWAFCRFRSLVCIDISPAIRVIKDGAVFDCSGMTAAILNNELEEIGAWAFCRWGPLVRIKIPPSRQDD